jgi:hypothetical protein
MNRGQSLVQHQDATVPGTLDGRALPAAQGAPGLPPGPGDLGTRWSVLDGTEFSPLAMRSRCWRHLSAK